MAEQDVLKLVGLSLGRSKEPAKLRLYLTRNFSRYFEFPRKIRSTPNAAQPVVSSPGSRLARRSRR